jgi:Na+-translocating ferredoxin:NAD+ oxidoreductase subunit B
MASAEQIDALLPQTQCTRCGYEGCRPYAQAIADGAALINQCPPGGAATITALARLTGSAELPLNPANGAEGPELVALIDEVACIGCAKCLPPCPVDAIVGAQKQMHTVLLALCTGCELCIVPCPVDCIRMVPRSSLETSVAAPTPLENRARYLAHNLRRTARAERRAEVLSARKPPQPRP